MIRTKVSEKTLWDHFTKILQGTVYSMAAQDEEFLNEYVEATFAKAILGRTQSLLKNGYKVFLFYSKLVLCLNFEKPYIIL